MCHDTVPASLPKPGPYQLNESNGINYQDFTSDNNADVSVALLTDIYGCNDFYQSLATYFAAQGWQSPLVDFFSELGELPEVTREAAFARRHNLHDREICDALVDYINEKGISAIVGFCLGGNFVMELAHRKVQAKLVAFYPFPAGLPNQDAIEPAFTYLDQLEQAVSVLMGAQDDRVGIDNVKRLAEAAENIPALKLNVYPDSKHGFLEDLDSTDSGLQKNAAHALETCLNVISGKAGSA